MTETKCFRDVFRDQLHELSVQPNNVSIVLVEVSDQAFCMPFFESSKLLIDNFSSLSCSIDHIFSINVQVRTVCRPFEMFSIVFLEKILCDFQYA